MSLMGAAIEGDCFSRKEEGGRRKEITLEGVFPS